MGSELRNHEQKSEAPDRLSSVREMSRASSMPTEVSKEIQSPKMDAQRNAMMNAVRNDLQAPGMLNKGNDGVFTTAKVDKAYNPTGGMKRDPLTGIYVNGGSE